MKTKFTMDLVWHNCGLMRPAEDKNPDLYVTDGNVVFKAAYSSTTGWYNMKNFKYLPDDEIERYWWADITRTVSGDQRFAG